MVSEELTLNDYRQDKQRWMRDLPVALQRRRHMSFCVMFASPVYLAPLLSCKRTHLLQRKPSTTPHKWEKKRGREMWCKGTNATLLPAVFPDGKLCLEHRHRYRLIWNQLNLSIKYSWMFLCMTVTSFWRLRPVSRTCVLFINLKDGHLRNANFVQHRFWRAYLLCFQICIIWLIAQAVWC